jgi:hypothetical protein
MQRTHSTGKFRSVHSPRVILSADKRTIITRISLAGAAVMAAAGV